MMFCENVVSRGRSRAVKWNQRGEENLRSSSHAWQEGFQQSGKSKGFRQNIPCYSSSHNEEFCLVIERIPSPTLRDGEISALAAACGKWWRKSSPVRVVMAIARRTWTTSIQPIEVRR